jgi:hypothetical protein
VARPIAAAWSVTASTPIELSEIVVTTTARELLAGYPHRNPERSLIRTLAPRWTEMTHVEPFETTCTAGFATMPHVFCALATVVVVAPTLVTDVVRTDNVNVAIIRGRLSKAPMVPFISQFSHPVAHATVRLSLVHVVKSRYLL